MDRRRYQAIERFVAAGRRGIEAAAQAEREHRARGDEVEANLAQIAVRVMEHKLQIVESRDVSPITWRAASGIGRFLSEYHWSATDEPFVCAMEEANELWGPALEALRPEWGPWGRRDRGP